MVERFSLPWIAGYEKPGCRDLNAELVLTCQTVRNKLDALLPRLQEHKGAHADKKYYYLVRKATTSPDAVEVAARFIYLNKTCYNGLYRVNKKWTFQCS